jgi:hypothetical protein
MTRFSQFDWLHLGILGVAPSHLRPLETFPDTSVEWLPAAMKTLLHAIKHAGRVALCKG